MKCHIPHSWIQLRILEIRKSNNKKYIRILHKRGHTGKVLGFVFPFKNEIYICQGASEFQSNLNRKGIHTFIGVIAHESEHINIKKYHWPNGYLPDSDCNSPFSDCDYDRYPKWFEDIPEMRELYGFHPTVGLDAYNLENVFNFDQENNIYNPAGYRYEEYRCRQIAEKNANVTQYDMKDWSFELSHKFQGKQWK